MATIMRRLNGVLNYADPAYSAALGKSLWHDAPINVADSDPAIAQFYRNHFHTYAAGDYTITTTEGGAGDATEALTDETGGVLLITNDALDDDSDALQIKSEGFQLVSGRPLWLEGRFKISDATQSDFFFGLCVTDTTLIDGVQDSVCFTKTDAATALVCHCDKDNTDTTKTLANVMADATWVRLGITVPAGGGEVRYWVNGVQVFTSTTNIPNNELMRISFEIQNGEGAAKTLSADYIWALQMNYA